MAAAATHSHVGLPDRRAALLIQDLLVRIVGSPNVDLDVDIDADATHDEALGGSPVRPLAVVRPASTEQVAAIVKAAVSEKVPLTARGSGTGLSGACVPVDGGVVVSFERMNRILEIDIDNHVAVVEPGVTLADLDTALLPSGLIYPVFPGEQSAASAVTLRPMQGECGLSSMA